MDLPWLQFIPVQYYPPLVILFGSILMALAIREFNTYNKMKNQIHKYEYDFINVKKDIDVLKEKLDTLESEHGELHPRKGGRRY